MHYTGLTLDSEMIVLLNTLYFTRKPFVYLNVYKYIIWYYLVRIILKHNIAIHRFLPTYWNIMFIEFKDILCMIFMIRIFNRLFYKFRYDKQLGGTRPEHAPRLVWDTITEKRHRSRANLSNNVCITDKV